MWVNPSPSILVLEISSMNERNTTSQLAKMRCATNAFYIVKIYWSPHCNQESESTSKIETCNKHSNIRKCSLERTASQRSIFQTCNKHSEPMKVSTRKTCESTFKISDMQRNQGSIWRLEYEEARRRLYPQ